MQGKMKSFFEDAGIVLVLSATIYGGYYFYTTFVNESENNNKVSENILAINDIVKIKKDDNSTSNLDVKEKKTIINEENKFLTSVVDVPAITPIKVKEEEIQKKTIEKPLVIKKVEIQKELVKKEVKKIDKVELQKFIQSIETKMSQSIRVNSNIDEKTNINLKIRVTLLKNGSSEQLIFTGGDKKLYNENRKNLLKIFPLTVEESYVNAFPRYLRLTLK